MSKEELKENLKKLGRSLIDNPNPDNEVLQQEVIANFLQLSKEEQVDFVNFIQSSTISVNTSEDSPKYPLKNVLALSILDASDDIISGKKQREYLDSLLDVEAIDQELILGLNTPLERAILRGNLPAIKFLIEEKNNQPAYVVEVLFDLIKKNFRGLSSEQELTEEVLEKAKSNSECYNYILRQVNLLDIEAEGAATIVIDLSKTIKEAIGATKDSGPREIVERLIGDLRESQDYIETQLFDISHDSNIEEVKEIKGAIVKALKLSDGYILLSGRLKDELLLDACSSGSVELVKYLVEQTGVIDSLKYLYGGNLLYSACLSGSVALIKYLVEEGADVDVVDAEGYTPLTMVCENVDVALVKCLVEARADVNLADKSRNTPLMKACRSGSVELVNT